HARRRHRRGLRPARRSCARSHDGAPGIEARVGDGAAVRRTLLLSCLGLCVVLAACTSTDSRRSTPQPERAAEINLELGIDYLRKGNLQQAKEKIDRSLQQNPRHARTHGIAAMLYD